MESEISPIILLAGPVVFGLVYWLLFQFYRNTNKSHNYEQETAIESQKILENDRRTNHISRTSRRRTSGANESSHRKRVTRL